MIFFFLPFVVRPSDARFSFVVYVSLSFVLLLSTCQNEEITIKFFTKVRLFLCERRVSERDF